MEFRILGPVELWSGGHRHDVGWARERCVLAILLMTPGRPVSAESMIGRVWDGEPPPKARDRLYSHIARLRGRLNDLDEDVGLRHRSGGYVLEADPETVDYHRFRVLRAQARSVAESGDDQHALQLHKEALALWRGEPLSGLDGSWAAHTRRSVEEELLAGTFDRLELELREGHHADLVGELSDLIARFPFNEKPTELLMLALYRSGRQGDALETYQEARRRLSDELGAETGPRLRELHRRILNGDPSLMPARRPPPRPEPPSNLPRDLRTFTGRAVEIGHLVRAVGGADDAPAVLVIDGMPGVGKTALAVHLAHRLSSRYPDGQLYLDMHTHDTERSPIDSAAALDRLLRALGLPSSRMPQELHDRAALWRSELAHRQVLVLLDDALGYDQLRHLLPGAPGSLVIITSRRYPSGLDDVQSLSLEVLPPADAATLFTRVIGPRPSLTAHDVETVVRLCGHLPLAIQLVGNRLRHRTTWSVADLADRLMEDTRRLREISAENREVTAAFELSFQGLDEQRRHAFRLLGLHPGPDFTVEAAAALLGNGQAEAESLLDGILDHHLITEPRRGRYRFHDLIRMYARQLAGQMPDDEGTAALRRLLDHYLAISDEADARLYPHRARAALQITRPGRGSGLETTRQAQDWFEMELENLLQVARYAADHGWPTQAGLFSYVVAGHLEASGRWEDAAQVHALAVTSGKTINDRTSVARAMTDLATVLWRAGRHEEALQHAQDALSIRREEGDTAAVARLLDQIGLIHWHRSEFDVALGYCEQSLETRQSLGDRRGEAESLNHIAIVRWHRGEYTAAGDRMRAALTIYSELDDRLGRQMTLNNLGDVELRLGHYSTALQLLEEAAAARPEMGRQHRAIWLNNLANVYQRIGRVNEALEHYRTALSTYRDIGDRRCEADTLNNIGSCYARMNRDGEALIHHQKALQLSREISERYEEAEALRGIGLIQRRAGRHATAIEHYEPALDLARAIGDIYQEARVMDEMAKAVVHIRGRSSALRLQRRALELYEHLGVPEADTVRSALETPTDAAES